MKSTDPLRQPALGFLLIQHISHHAYVTANYEFRIRQTIWLSRSHGMCVASCYTGSNDMACVLVNISISDSAFVSVDNWISTHHLYTGEMRSRYLHKGRHHISCPTRPQIAFCIYCFVIFHEVKKIYKDQRHLTFKNCISLSMICFVIWSFEHENYNVVVKLFGSQICLDSSKLFAWNQLSITHNCIFS